jgi:hypothetical protein
MDRSATFRRAFHIASPLFLSYFLLPDTIALNITRLSLAVLFIGTAGCIEIARIALGIKLFGMRPYEGQRVSAYAQGLLGLVIGIFVVQKAWIVVPVFLGMAWIDPLAAHARRHRWLFALPVAAYFALFLATETAMNKVPTWSARLIFAAIATVAAMAVEGPRIPQLDDDLMMQLLPYGALIVAAALLPTAGLL